MWRKLEVFFWLKGQLSCQGELATSYQPTDELLCFDISLWYPIISIYNTYKYRQHLWPGCCYLGANTELFLDDIFMPAIRIQCVWDPSLSNMKEPMELVFVGWRLSESVCTSAEPKCFQASHPPESAKTQEENGSLISVGWKRPQIFTSFVSIFRYH